ncbi:serine acetyltransferase [Paenibacillus albus]|uniref:Serine acetyltransferase n=2 Tax=Paenibacillus albus TaxID=2495582 RepID=A0A3Q8X2G5_9BACL|nr:serine acetyltransferase [Paenibacillus albus]
MNAISLYRVSNWFYRKKIPIVPKVLKAITFLMFNSVVPYTTEIGRDSKFAYGAIGVVIHGRSKIGSRVIIGQNVTIGRALDPDSIPEIGDNVYISAGARIIGKIKIGNNVIIGANSVVTKDVPNNSIVAGIPAKVLRSVDEDIYSLLKNIY